MKVSAIATFDHRLSQAWRDALLPLTLLVAGVLLVYRGTFQEMFLIWLRSDTFAHCLFVWPISLWLIWRQRSVAKSMAPAPAPWMLLPMFAVAAVWLFGQLVAVNAVVQLAVTALLVMSVVLVLGRQVGMTMLFPLGFMFFGVPIGEFLLPQFMSWTADFTVMALRLSGVPVYREGLQFVIPSGQWSVVEACSGVRYLMASLVVGTLFAYLNYRSSWRRWVFVGISILVPVVANWLRAYMIVMLGHLSGNELATGADHLVYGWVFFGVVMLLMFMIGARWREDAVPASTAVAAEIYPSRVTSPSKNWIVAMLGLLVVSSAPLWFSAFGSHSADRTPELRLPTPLSSAWRRLESEPVFFRPEFQNPAAEVSSWFGLDSMVVGLHVSYYSQQDASRKLVSSSNVVVKSSDRRWLRLSSGSRTLELSDEQALKVDATELRPRGAVGVGSDSNLVVWRLYWVDDRFTSSDFLAKLYAAWGRFMGRPDDAAAIFVFAPRGVQGDIAAVLERFTKDNLDSLRLALVATRDKRNLAER